MFDELFTQAIKKLIEEAVVARLVDMADRINQLERKINQAKQPDLEELRDQVSASLDLTDAIDSAVRDYMRNDFNFSTIEDEVDDRIKDYLCNNVTITTTFDTI